MFQDCSRILLCCFSRGCYTYYYILLYISVAKIDQFNKHHRIHNSFPQDNEEKNTTSRLGMARRAGRAGWCPLHW